MRFLKRYFPLIPALILTLLCAGGALAEREYDHARSEHDIGTCLTLSGDAAIVVLFANDDVSQWDEASMREVMARVNEGAAFLRDSAKAYGYDLTLPTFFYADNANREIRYSGVIETGGAKLNALASIAENWGYDSAYHMHDALLDHTGMDQIAYIVAHNKDGYTFAQGQSHQSDWIDWCDPEYCVLAIRTINGYTNPASVYMHELLHLFGAQDLYRKEIGGVVYNDSREKAAKELCPGEIMDVCYGEFSDLQISGFTAYCIGWLDFLPANYDTHEWWAGTQWEDEYMP